MSGEVIEKRRFIDYDEWRAASLEQQTSEYLKRFSRVDHGSGLSSVDSVFIEASFDVLQSAGVPRRFRTATRRPVGRRP